MRRHSVMDKRSILRHLVVIKQTLLLSDIVSQDSLFRLFELSGCLDVVEGLQYHKNQEIYELSNNIIVSFCEAEELQESGQTLIFNI